MGRIIVVHMRDAILNAEEGGDAHPAHCFGPFADYPTALAFDLLAPDDCYKIALDLVGPDPGDIEDEPVHGPHHDGWHGSGPASYDRRN